MQRIYQVYRKRPDKDGFTLIELLVVISIIAVLLSILMPALNKAKDKVKQVTCMSNVRQIGIAIIAYAVANDGYFPRNVCEGEYWGPCVYYAPGYVDFNLMEDLYPYLQNLKVFVDPAVGEAQRRPVERWLDPDPWPDVYLFYWNWWYLGGEYREGGPDGIRISVKKMEDATSGSPLFMDHGIDATITGGWMGEIRTQHVKRNRTLYPDRWPGMAAAYYGPAYVTYSVPSPQDVEGINATYADGSTVFVPANELIQETNWGDIYPPIRGISPGTTTSFDWFIPRN